MSGILAFLLRVPDPPRCFPFSEPPCNLALCCVFCGGTIWVSHLEEGGDPGIWQAGTRTTASFLLCRLQEPPFPHTQQYPGQSLFLTSPPPSPHLVPRPSSQNEPLLRGTPCRQQSCYKFSGVPKHLFKTCFLKQAPRFTC